MLSSRHFPTVVKTMARQGGHQCSGGFIGNDLKKVTSLTLNYARFSKEIISDHTSSSLTKIFAQFSKETNEYHNPSSLYDPLKVIYGPLLVSQQVKIRPGNNNFRSRVETHIYSRPVR